MMNSPRSWSYDQEPKLWQEIQISTRMTGHIRCNKINTSPMEESPKLTVLDVSARDMSSGESDQVWDPSDPVQALLNPRARQQLNREQ